MDVDLLVEFLDQPRQSEDWLRAIGVRNQRAAHTALARIVQSGLTLDLAALMCQQLEQILPATDNADQAIANLERFVSASRNPLALGTFWQRDPGALQTLLEIFAASQHFSDLLLENPESLDLLRMTGGEPTPYHLLVEEFSSEVAALTDDSDALAALVRLISRERLRIAYGDIVQHQAMELVTTQISELVGAIAEAVLAIARRRLEQRRGTPRLADGSRAEFAILALGPLGGNELSYSSDIDLMFLYQGDGRTDGSRPMDNSEFFQRLSEHFIQLLDDILPHEGSFQPRLRMRAGRTQEVVALDADAALRYYEQAGRTWERQEMVKARPLAGDRPLAEYFVEAARPWIYRRYLTTTDIGGIKALKRRLIQRLEQRGGGQLDVRTGRGGVNDIEHVIQFLQLLNGGDSLNVRSTNTLEAIDQLATAGCLTEQEQVALRDSYLSLRRIEHYLQILFDPLLETIPTDDERLKRLAQKLGYADTESGDELRRKFQQRQQVSADILTRLLAETLGEDHALPEADLLYDPWPNADFVEQILSRHNFKDCPAAQRNLTALATEPTQFLSTRRSRFYLAEIAAQLLEAIAETPDPDTTLSTLSRVSDAIGAKGVLWELFSFNAPSMKLYVRMCAASPYLTGILTSFPGMIDELLDSLLLEQLPTRETLDRTLLELTRGEVSIESIVHGFKSSQHLGVGVRDLLGKDSIRTTHEALSDITEVCLTQLADDQQNQLIQRHGEPRGPDGTPSSFIMLALGKLGGREPNYHSDTDVVFLFDHDGTTHHQRRGGETTTNAHFYNELARRILQVVSQQGPLGRLLDLDGTLRATQPHAPLAISLDDFEDELLDGDLPLAQRIQFCKARAIYGDDEARQRADQLARQAVLSASWHDGLAQQIYKQRTESEQTASVRNIKRGPGGSMDVEAIVQMLQLKLAGQQPEVLTPGTLDSLQLLRQQGELAEAECRVLSQSYDLLRSIESGLRLMNTTARHDLPEDQQGLAQLAFLLKYDDARQLVEQCQHYRAENRRLFREIFERHSAIPISG